MSIRNCCSVLVGTAMSVVALHCSAATVPFDYGVILTAQTAGPGFKSIASLGSVSISGPLGNAVAGAGTSPAPYVTVDATSTAPATADPSAETAANGQFGYSYVVVGPAGTSVPLWVTASGSVSRSGASSGAGLHDAAHAYLKVTPQFFPTVLAAEICTGNGFVATVPGTVCAAGTTDSFAFTAHRIVVPANTVIFVDLWAGALATRGGHAAATIDPYIEIDPTFVGAAQYSLVLSAGIAQQPPPAVATVVEYYHAALDHYFITWLPNEIAILDAGTQIKGWTRTGTTFKTYTNAQPGASPVCRFYIPPALGDSHFFGRGTAECDATGRNNPSFVLEDATFMRMVLPTAGNCPAGTKPIYRVFSNRPDANHRYLTDLAARNQMVTKGWLAEGDGPDLVVMCAPV